MSASTSPLDVMAQSLAAAERSPATERKGEPLLRIASVTKRFGGFTAIDDLSLDINAGEFFALLGPSGCGKTTLLRMLAGLESPDSGHILLDGADIAQVPPHLRPVNMMFQSYALFPHLDVAGNVAYGLKREGAAKAEIAARVAEALALVKLEGLGGRRPTQLSGGQRQRVALARALVKRPKLLLLDEPLAALDRKLREHTQFELISIQQRLGVTCIVVTHDQEEAMTLGTRLGVMNHGRIAQVGTPSDIYESPVTRFVADFIGSVNMFEGRVSEDGAECVRIRSEELGCTVRAERSVHCVGGSTVWTAIRPEKINISRHRPLAASAQRADAAENVVRGTVREIAYMGDMSIYLVQLDSGRMMRVTLPNITRGTERGFAREESVWLSWHGSSPVVLTE